MESATLRPASGSPLSTRAGLTGALVALAAGAWAITVARMQGMDAAPGGDLGDAGWFTLSWLAMMAAMMLPAAVPAALVQLRGPRRAVAPFLAGYLALWTLAGVAAYLLLEGVRSLDVTFLAWDRAGRYLAACVILAAATYQFTGAKARCLERCRDVTATRTGSDAGLLAGLRHGAWCLGCCAGMMAALFALGVMSLAWMAVVAALIAAERLLGRRAAAVHGVAAVLLVVAIWMAVSPGSLPGLTLPSAMGGM